MMFAHRNPTVCLTTAAAILALGLIAHLAAAQDAPIALVGATLIPIEGAEIHEGTLLIHEGRIVAVGPHLAIPDDAEIRDVTGAVIMPGLICTHSHIGGIGGADRSGPLQPDVRIHDSINVRDAGFRRAVAGGLTTLNIMPGSGHLLSGQTVYVKLRRAEKIDDILIYDDEGRLMGGLKMANGTNPMRDRPWPGTRARIAAMMREQFIAAEEYREKRRRAEDDPENLKKVPPRDLGLEALVDVLAGRTIVHFHTHRHDDIMTAIRLSREFDFRIVLHHVSDGWKVADQIAAAGVPCSIILIDSPGGKQEALGLAFETGAVLEEAGVLTALHTDDYITDSRLFLRMAAMAVRGGMSRQGALEALTINGARMLDLEERIGSLAPGKDADFIILSGDPLSLYTGVLQTWVEGEKVFDHLDEDDQLAALGGYGAMRDQSTYFCCFDQGGDACCD